MVGVGGGLPLAIHSINSFLALSTGRVRKWDAWGGGGSGDLSVKLCSTPLSLAPPDGGARKKDHQEAWARRCLFIGAGAVLEGDGPQKPGQDPCPQLFPPAGDTLSQGHLFHQLLQKERDDDETRSLELRQSLERGLLEHGVRGMGSTGERLTCNKWA